MENLRLDEFLEQICWDNGEWSRLEILNYLESITSGFDLKKLNILKREIEFFSSCFLEELIEREGEEKLNNFSALSEVPFRQTETLEYKIAKREGDFVEGIPKYYPPYIDYESIFTHELFPLKQVENLVDKKIQGQKSKSSTKVKDNKISSYSKEPKDRDGSYYCSKALSALETAYFIYYLIDSKEYSWINGTPGEPDWVYFSDKTGGRSTDNIRKRFNTIHKDEIRLRPSRKAVIRNVISYLEENCPQNAKAIKKAKVEFMAASRRLE